MADQQVGLAAPDSGRLSMRFGRNVPNLPRLRRSLVVRVVRRYAAANAGHWATNMAWNALFAFIPILLVLATAMALLFNAQSFELYLAREVATLFHARPAGVLTVFDSIRGKFWLLGLLSFAGLLWSGSALFSCVDCGLSSLSGVEPRRFFRRRARAVGMTVVFCLLLIPVLVSSALLSVPATRLPTSLVSLPGIVTATGGPRIALYLVQFVAGTVLATMLFTVVYVLVPNRRQRPIHVLRGAFCAGALLEALTLIFPIYLRSTSSNGSVALLLALPLLLTFFFCVGQIIVIGHLVNLETGDVVSEAAHVPVVHSRDREAPTSG